MDNTERLRDVTRVLLDTTRPAYTLRAEVLQLKSIFEQASGRTFGSANIESGETPATDGVAISPAMAAMCLDDYSRTVHFIRGLHDAIRDVRAVIDRPVRVFYAGCGPWATLAVPLMSVLTADDVRFELIDMHEESIELVETMIEALGMRDRVESMEVADAMRYQITSRPDVILIEMMRAALEVEPQVAVAMHLMEQASDALLVPTEIRVDLALVDSRSEFSFDADLAVRKRIEIGPVFCLNKETIATGAELFRPVSFQLPDFDEVRYRPMLLTTVRVHGEHVLSDYDSGITTPVRLPTKKTPRSREKVELLYEQSSRPGFRVRGRSEDE